MHKSTSMCPATLILPCIQRKEEKSILNRCSLVALISAD